ncbi:V-type ATP synthase subunit F [Pedococcus sp. KACC 23699]|uniref:V-type ATP synthase subunit F n=1 Tax=Pedococcus sp. KACC 23699 TaxID=3149228 RepID=A0AAU7JSG7_9MICO
MSPRQDRGGDAVVAVVGDPDHVAGFGLAGAQVVSARTESEALRAWTGLADAALVILTPATASWLSGQRREPGAPITVVLPE